MNVFNIIGPVMIGPSSSHTAGACRLGRVVNKIIDGGIVREVKIQLSGSFAHPNTARITYVCEDGKTGVVEGASIGGGNIRVDRIDGMNVSFTGESNTLLVLHKDTPGVIANVTNLMYWRYGDLNIGNFHLSRKERGGTALMTIEIDQLPPEQLIEDLKKMDNIDNALLIRAV